MQNTWYYVDLWIFNLNGMYHHTIFFPKSINTVNDLTGAPCTRAISLLFSTPWSAEAPASPLTEHWDHHQHHHNITLILFKANYPCWLMLKTWFISCRVPIHWTIFTVAERTYPLVYPIRSCKPFSSLSWYILHKSQQWPERTWVRQLGAGGPVGPDWSPETRHQATNCFDFGFGLESLSWEEKTRSDDEHEHKRVQLLPNMETCLLTWLDKSPKRSGDKRHWFSSWSPSSTAPQSSSSASS